MKCYLISIGTKMPQWINDGFTDYAKRLTGEVNLELIELASEKRGKNTDLARIKEIEGKRLLAAIPKNCLMVTLAINGKNWSTEQLANRLTEWQHMGQPIAFLIGGPEGLSEACNQRADLAWSLSPLTFPHPLVRVIIAEQLYRAWSITKNHPYHR